MIKPQRADDTFDDDPIEPAAGPARSRQLLRELLDRWYWIPLFIIAGVGCAMYYLSKAIPEYSSVSTLLIKQQTSGVLSKDQPEEMDMRSVEAMNTVAERLKRMKFLETVATRDDVRSIPGIVPLAPDWLPMWAAAWTGGDERKGQASRAVPEPAVLAGMIASRMTVSVRRGTRLLDIQVRHPVPAAAAVIADAVASEYVKEMTSNRAGGRSASIEVLSLKSEEARRVLQSAQGALNSYVRALATHEQLEAKEREFAELKRRYLPKHPKMIACDGQVKELQRRFLEEFDTAISTGPDQDYWKTVSLPETGESGEAARLGRARQAMLARTAVLKSEIQSQEVVFNSILTKMGETDVNQGSVESEIEISSEAMVPVSPVSPVPMKTMVTGGGLGAAIGLALAFLLAKLDSRFHTVMQLEEMTGLPVFAAMPQLPARALKKIMESSHKEGSGHERKWAASVVFRKALADTSFAEMFRVLRASVSMIGNPAERKVTLFLSSVPGEGKTFTSVNFALACGAQGQRVLLIDGDLRKPSVHKVLGIDASGNPHGVAEVLAGHVPFEQAVLTGLAGPNVDLLVGGTRSPNPGELLHERTLRPLIEKAASLYDVVVIDSAPLLSVPDSFLIAPFAHNLCLVARAEYVPRHATLRAIEMLDSKGLRVSGLVMNGFKNKKRLLDANYSYGSYRYGRYGRAYGYGQYGSYGSDQD